MNTREYNQQYYQLNKEKIRKRSLDHAKTHREQKNADSRRWYAAHAEETRAIRRANSVTWRKTKHHGLLPGEWEAILTRQNNVCAVCLTAEPGGRHSTWNVDHNHACCEGKRSCGWCVRGLLCHTCNTVEVHGMDLAVAAGRLAADAHTYLRDNWTHHRPAWRTAWMESNAA